MKRTSRQRVSRLEGLEERQYLSALVPPSRAAEVSRLGAPVPAGHFQRQRLTPPPRASALRRPTPLEFINQQYIAFVADFESALSKYLASLATSTPGATIQVSQPLTVPSPQGSGLLIVANASVFGVVTPETPLGVVVSVGGLPQGSYVVTAVTGNTLILQNSAPLTSPVPSESLPVGSVVQASVAAPVDNSAAMFPAFVQERVAQMTQRIVTYFNRLPIKLPKAPTPPRTPTQRNAVQAFVNQTLQGGGSESLYVALLSLPLPTSTSPAELQLYQQTFRSVIDQNRNSMIEGVRLLFAGQTLASPQTPIYPATPN